MSEHLSGLERVLRRETSLLAGCLSAEGYDLQCKPLLCANEAPLLIDNSQSPARGPRKFGMTTPNARAKNLKTFAPECEGRVGCRGGVSGGG